MSLGKISNDSVMDVPASDGRSKDSRSSDAGAEEIDRSVENLSSVTRAAESLKKEATFPVRRVQSKGSGIRAALRLRLRNDRLKQKKAAAQSHGLESSGERTRKWKSICSEIIQKNPSDVVNDAGEGDTIEMEMIFSAETEYVNEMDDSENNDFAPQHGLLFKKLR